MLSQADGIEFGEIQTRTQLTKSALSKHVSQLATAGYISEKQIVRQGRSRLLVALTPAGRAAYKAHRASLTLLLEEGE
jgi:DNA-binding MarR family transcriptional regulator